LFSVNGIEGFVGCMSTLAAFTLSAYTSIILGRYWTMRTAGIGQTWGACRELCFWLPEIVTRDPEIIRTIRRYARASLSIAFMERRPGSIEHNVKSDLVNYELLTKEEARSILAVGSSYSRVPWAWIAAIIEKLGQNQTIETPNILNYLMTQVEHGRRGLEVIGTHMSVQVPLPLVHLLGFLIKLHNLILAVCYGYMVAACDCGYYFSTVKVFLVPFFYNGLLAINSEIADPFDGGVNDFPFKMYEEAMEAEGQAFYEAGEHRPDFIDQCPALKLK
jgi:predicted membrane chloride channel (bestrophin family)